MSVIKSDRREQQILAKNTRLNLEVDEWEDPKRPKTPSLNQPRPPPKLIWRKELQDVGVFFPEDEPIMLQETKDLEYIVEKFDEDDVEEDDSMLLEDEEEQHC